MKRLVLLLLLALCGLAGALEIANFVAPEDPTPQYSLWEATFALLSGANISNPFDPSQIVVSARFDHAKSGAQHAREAFYMRKYNRTSTSAPEVLAAGNWTWALRFAPPLDGSWTVRLHANASGTLASFGPLSFTCSAVVTAAKQSPVRVSPRDGRFFEHSDGSVPFVPIGENVCWGGTGQTHDIDLWLSRLSGKASMVRYWMCSWWHTLEWTGSGSVLGNYTAWQWRMWQLDHDIEAAKERNLVVMLCLLNHGAVSTKTNPEWGNNPYSIQNGGMCKDTHAFFTNAEARALFARRLRYIVARVGWAPNIIWELANEIDWTDNYSSDATVRADVVAWHKEMAAVIRLHDSAQHMVTTSTASSFFPSPSDSKLDFVQIHDYSRASNRDTTFRSTIKEGRTLLPGHPVFVGEAGICGSGSETAQLDPTGIELHNRLWGSLLGGAAGGAMPWWWDSNTEPLDLYYHFAGATKFMEGRDIPAEQYTVKHITSDGCALAIVSPSHPFGNSSFNHFVVDIAENTVSPPSGEVPAFLFGAKWNTQYRNPPSFVATWENAGSFSVQTASSGTLPTLKISVDGICVFHQNASESTKYSVPIAAGEHTIALDNLGTDWIEISALTFASGNQSSPFAAVDVAALVGPRSALAWVRNLEYNYLSWNRTSQLVGVPLSISELPAASAFAISWFNTTSGAVFKTMEATSSSSGVLDLVVPAFTWDVALSAEILGVPSSEQSDSLHSTAPSSNVASVAIVVATAAFVYI